MLVSGSSEQVTPANPSNTSGTLRVSSGGIVVADITLVGKYATSNFHISSGAGGTVEITDPSVANITTLGNLRALSGLKAIASPDGTPLLVNALPGQLGGLAIGTGTAPSTWRLDMNLLKRIKINDRFTFKVGATAQNLSNTPQLAAPNTSISSANFGRITGTASTYRIVVLQARLNF